MRVWCAAVSELSVPVLSGVHSWHSGSCVQTRSGVRVSEHGLAVLYTHRHAHVFLYPRSTTHTHTHTSCCVPPLSLVHVSEYSYLPFVECCTDRDTRTLTSPYVRTPVLLLPSSGEVTHILLMRGLTNSDSPVL